MKKLALFTLSLFSTLSLVKAMELPEDDINPQAQHLAQTANQKIQKLGKKRDTFQPVDIEYDIYTTQINILTDLLTSSMLPEDTFQEQQYKQGLIQQALNSYRDVKDLKKTLKKDEKKKKLIIFKKEEIKEEKKEEKAILPTSPMFRPALPAPQITWEDYEEELALGDALTKSTVKWTLYGNSAFGNKLQGVKDYRNLNLVALTPKEEMVSSENKNLTLLAQREPKLLGQYALAYKAENIDTPFFLVAEDLMNKPEEKKESSSNTATIEPVNIFVEPANISEKQEEKYIDIVNNHDPLAKLNLILHMDEQIGHPKGWELVSAVQNRNSNKPLIVKKNCTGIEILGDNYTFFNEIPTLSNFDATTFLFSVELRGTKPGAYVQYWDGVQSVNSIPYNGNRKGEWETLSVEFTVTKKARFHRLYAAILGPVKGNEIPSLDIKSARLQPKPLEF